MKNVSRTRPRRLRFKTGRVEPLVLPARSNEVEQPDHPSSLIDSYVALHLDEVFGMRRYLPHAGTGKFTSVEVSFSL
jgi:hypothetical protein